MMARRPARRVVGDPVWRRAVLAEDRHLHAAFPTPGLADRIEATEAGAAVVVSCGVLLRGLHRLRLYDLADLFRYDPAHGERRFELDADDVLTEV